MAVPLHQHSSFPLASPAADVHTRLTADPGQLVATATGDALTALAPLVATWGLAPNTLPTVTATPADPGTPGAVTVSWHGVEEETAWPSSTGQLIVVAEPDTGCRLVFVSPRSRGAELATDRLGRLHRQRIVDMAYAGFLQQLGRQLGHRGPVAAPGVTHHDQRPVFVHHVQQLSADPDRLAGRLLDRRASLATTATDAALEHAAAALAQGRFRAPAAPRTTVRAATPDEFGLLHLGWESDEEATGWPAITLTLAVEATSHGAGLLVLSPRPPGYDLSTNRIDRRARDQVLQEVGRQVSEAISQELAPVTGQRTAPEAAIPSGVV